MGHRGRSGSVAGGKCRKSAPRFRRPGWECRKKCRKTAEKMYPAPFFSISRTFSAVFRHFFRHSQPGLRNRGALFRHFPPRALRGPLWLVGGISTQGWRWKIDTEKWLGLGDSSGQTHGSYNVLILSTFTVKKKIPVPAGVNQLLAKIR